MIAKICLVMLLGCVLIQAERKFSERTPIDHVGSAERAPEEITKSLEEAQAYMDAASLDEPQVPGSVKVITDQEFDSLFF